MITLQSKDADILREVKEGMSKLGYWFIKTIGGERKYDEMIDTLSMRCARMNEVQTSDVVEYIDKNGNRWRAYVRALPLGGGLTDTSLDGFIYYETYGSCGAIVPQIKMMAGGGKKNGVIIYTSHFFMRMCQRLGVEYRSSAMIKSFVKNIYFQQFQFDDKNLRAGKPQVVFCLPGSKAFGIQRYNGEEGEVLEVRTFLKNTEMTKNRRKAYAELEERSKFKYHSQEELRMRFADMKTNEEKMAFIDEQYENLEHLGLSKKLSSDTMNVLSLIMGLFLELGYITKKEVKPDHDTVLDTLKFVSSLQDEGFAEVYEFMLLIDGIATRMCPEKYAMKDVARNLVDLFELNCTDIDLILKLGEYMKEKKSKEKDEI